MTLHRPSSHYATAASRALANGDTAAATTATLAAIVARREAEQQTIRPCAKVLELARGHYEVE